MKVTIVAGARPNFMKIAPIMRAMDSAGKEGKNIFHRLVYTGTKTDDTLEPSLFSDLRIKEPDVYLGVDDKNPVTMAAGIMTAFDRELHQNPAQVVIVVDDLISTMACTIVAKKHNVKVAHLAAGTRSFDMTRSKEVNRIIADSLSDYLFIAGMGANRNLSHTGIDDERIYNVGNVLMDTIRYNRSRFTCPVWFPVLGLKENGYILLTVNRRSLLNNEKKLRPLMETLVAASHNVPIVAPLHPYARDVIKGLQLKAPNLHFLPPQSYLSFGYLVNKARGIITDSGNIAEEATFLGVPCITLNSYAEHPETYRIGTNELTDEDPAVLETAVRTLLDGKWKKGSLPERWDGRSAERIIQILLENNGRRDF